MPKKKKRGKRNIPFCADPDNHVLVTTRERIFWRRKRKKGNLDTSFASNVDLSKIAGPAAGNVVQKLRPYLRGIDAGRITLRVSNALRKYLKEKGRCDLQRWREQRCKGSILYTNYCWRLTK